MTVHLPFVQARTQPFFPPFAGLGRRGGAVNDMDIGWWCDLGRHVRQISSDVNGKEILSKRCVSETGRILLNDLTFIAILSGLLGVFWPATKNGSRTYLWTSARNPGDGANAFEAARPSLKTMVSVAIVNRNLWFGVGLSNRTVAKGMHTGLVVRKMVFQCWGRE